MVRKDSRQVGTGVDDYLAALPVPERTVLESIRHEVRALVPEAVEGIRYGMPSYLLGGAPLLSFAAFRRHMSIFGSVRGIEDMLGGFSLSHRGTVRFTADHPLPGPLVRAIILERVRVVSEGGS